MRIGLVSAEFPPAVGGVGDHTARLAHELARAGHEVEVLTSAQLHGPSSPGGVGVLREVRAWDFRIWRQVPRLARRRAWDILHIQYQPAAYALRGAINVLPWLTRGAMPAVVTTFHDLRVPYLFPKAGRLREAAVAALAKGSDAVIAVSDEDLPRLRRWRGGTPDETTRHVPLGDQLDAAAPADFSRTAWRSRLGVGDERSLVAYFGLVNASKGVLELIEALARVERAHLVMIGESIGASDATNRAYLEAVRRRVSALGLDERVHWTGYVTAPELAGWLEAADVVALPYADGATLRRTSLITAWRRGRAVVTTEPPPCAGWRSGPGDVAVFVPPGDVPRLAEALRELLRDPERRAAIGMAAAAFAERFSWPAVVRRTEAAYAAALSARRARRARRGARVRLG